MQSDLRSIPIVVVAGRAAYSHLNLDILLNAEGCSVELFGSAEATLERLRNNSVNLVIINMTVPDMSGLALIAAIRDGGISVPIVMLTAPESEYDCRAAVRLGATACIANPDAQAFMSCVRTALQGSHATAPNRNTGALVIDKAAHVISAGSTPIHFTPLAFQLLVMLVEARGAVISKATLLEVIWHFPAGVRTTTVESHIRLIRRKLKPFGLDHHLVTVPKVGYRWVE